MKNYKLLCVLLLIIPAASYAQEVRVGFKLLPEKTIKFGDYYEDDIDYKFNFINIGFGAQLVATLTDHIGVETGFYIQKQKFSEGYSGIGEREATFTFIQIPACLRVTTKYVYITLGPTLNYQLETKYEFSGGGSGEGNDEDKKFYAGIIGTVGRDWPINDKLSFISEVRLSGVPGHGAGANLGLGVGVNYKLQ